MKKILLLLLAFPILGTAQGLSGNYVIRSTNTDSNFKTLASALTHIKNVGLAGAVTFSLYDDQNISSTLVVNSLGTTAAKTLTIKPDTGRTIAITGNIGNSNTASLIKLNGTDYVIFDGSNNNTSSRNMTITNTSTANYNNLGEIHSAIFWIASNGTDAATNNIIRNIAFTGSNVDATSSTSAGIVISNNTNMATAETVSNSDTEISNNVFTRMKVGISVLGMTNTLNQNLNINKNIFGSATAANDVVVVSAMRISNAQNASITKNEISGITFAISNEVAASGIYLYNKSIGTKITQNTIKNIKRTSSSGAAIGIEVNIDNTSASNLDITNNIVSGIFTGSSNADDSTNAGHNIYITKGNKINLYYNTVVLNTSQVNLSAGLFISSVSNLSIKNNIFYSTQTTGKPYLIYSSVNHSVITLLNYNAYFAKTTATKIGKLVGTDYATFTNWQTALSPSGKETKSIDTEPKFTSDFHLVKDATNTPFHAKGNPIANITTDIDNEDRDTATPDIGADEIFLCEQGDQTSYGINEWRGYVYKWTGNPPPTIAATPDPNTTTYVGYVTEDAIFDRNVVAGNVTGKTANICGTAPNDKFFVRYKMQLNITEAGIYNLTVGADDGYRLYVDGTLVTDINNWNTHNYISSGTNKQLTAGNHLLVLEYFENISDSRVSFSYGLIKGDTSLPFGINEWNVYAFTSVLVDNNLFPIPTNSYAGSYVEKNLNIKTEDNWNKATSPSNVTNTGYKGAPIPKDDYTLSYRRIGFPCGRYSIEIANCDDNVRVLINDTPVYTAGHNVNDNTPESATNIGNYFALNESSKVEIIFKEYQGDARLTLSFKDNPVNYDGSIAPPSGSSIIVNSDLRLTSNLEVCSCTVAAGKTITVPENILLTVKENTIVNTGGKIIIENNGAFLQTNDNGTYTGAGIADSFEFNRTTTPISKFDFTFWSSPVAGFTLYKLSPTTLADKYQYYEPGVGWKTHMNGAKVMDPGIGYNVRGPQENATDKPQIYNAKFIGIPNNGVVTVPVKKTGTGGTTSNLIGNPYPSAIDAGAFYLANKDLIKGTFYFWTHAIPLSTIPDANGRYKYSNSNYISYNITGGTGAVDPATCKSCGGQKSEGFIPSGQGFIVEAKTSGDLKFTNALRLKTANNNKFSKPSNTKKEDVAMERNRVWLNMKNETGIYSEILLGYITGATNDLDEAYDGTSYATGTSLYSLLDNKKMVIQGRDLATPLENEIIPLGFISGEASEYTIGIESFDGFFSAVKVLLKDKVTNTTTNLKEGRYTFTTDKGTFNERFELSFAGKTLGVDSPLPETEIEKGISVYKKQNQIEVTSTDDYIQSIQVYDLLGKTIYTKTAINNNTFSTGDLRTRNQVVIVKIQTENNSEITKKILL
ncbi:T9SS sorting signal type C domain-containing protein [Flavobacterium sp. GA093]|uniref:T9SS sorting signal type C domain-containing protein n=1 Tax=Flavobacterium hydrocarbonoxydans TaxID=2683249 RepID=A0A6I4NHH0_9FLAO|nr:T9SS sorting signal type C domain-containing protein [Flavobacterium hydrocarbonoxydans]MWB93621.1 T9SS sorting signal type C domain-containing protein [Flavobacterium hydrocarbonoxydans]